MSNNFFPMASSRSGTGSPCGACRFLRRKCLSDCVFAPYFSSEESTERFAAIHKVFGASNVSKILLHAPVEARCEVIVTMAYEAEARLHDPVYGCVSHVFALQQQVAFLQAQLMQLKANVAHQTITTVAENMKNKSDMTWQQTSRFTTSYKPYSHENHNKLVSPQSSIVKHSNASSEVTRFPTNVQEIQAGRFGFHQDAYPNKKRAVSYCNSGGELQTLALRMMGNKFSS